MPFEPVRRDPHGGSSWPCGVTLRRAGRTDELARSHGCEVARISSQGTRAGSRKRTPQGQSRPPCGFATNGLERLRTPDAHDLYARILTDKHDYERAFAKWDMGAIAPHIRARSRTRLSSI